MDYLRRVISELPKILLIKNTRQPMIWLLIFIFSLIASSCSITKHVPDGKYLLNKTDIKVESKDIKPGDLETYLRQKPNKRIIGMRVHLGIYSLSSPYKYSGIHQRLKIIGEEPVILDTFLVKQSTENIREYLESKGYYQTKIKDSVYFPKNKRANISFTVTPGKPYSIGRISYVVEDSLISKLVLKDTVNALIRRGILFDSDILQEERVRIQSYLKNNGYYFFNKDFITYKADTTIGNNSVDLILNIRNRYVMLESGTKLSKNYLKYKINKVYLYPKFDPRELQAAEKQNQVDTVFNGGINYIFVGDPGIELRIVDQANLIRPGDIYSDDDVQKTQNNLTSLRLFRMANILFNEVAQDTTTKQNDKEFLFFSEQNKKDSVPTGLLNCFIQLTPHTLQSYQVEFVGTNTSGALGAETNLMYQHKNLFKGAEIFDIRFRGLIETVQKATENSNFAFNNSLELGGSIGLNIPRFLSPFSSKEYIKKYSPRTQITTSYNFQRRPEYTRTVAGLTFGYYWKNSKYVTHGINPMEINAINLQNIDPTWKNNLVGTEIYSYQNQIITLSSYSFTFNNQNIQKNTSYSYLRFNFESSGNLMRAIYSGKLNWNKDTTTYKIRDIGFSQFIRSDINLSYHQYLDEFNSIVYRVFFGLGYPYGNSKALPFDKKYFSGGANGMRAWSARSLGPGSVNPPDSTNYYNQTGDIKLEANIEYRFKLFWQLEGALFLDAGNVWLIDKKAEEDPNGIFKLDRFYRQIALGTGTGIRANLGFLTLRFDFGYPVYNPAMNPEKPFKPWVPFQQDFKWRDFTLNFGLGYPF